MSSHRTRSRPVARHAGSTWTTRGGRSSPPCAPRASRRPCRWTVGIASRDWIHRWSTSTCRRSPRPGVGPARPSPTTRWDARSTPGRRSSSRPTASAARGTSACSIPTRAGRAAAWIAPARRRRGTSRSRPARSGCAARWVPATSITGRSSPRSSEAPPSAPRCSGPRSRPRCHGRALDGRSAIPDRTELEAALDAWSPEPAFAWRSDA